MTLLAGIGLLLCSLNLVNCHTWIEQLSLVDQDGQPVGDPGFIRGYVPRTTPGFVDGDNTYLLPQAPALTFQDSDLMCKLTQTQGNQSGGSVLMAPQGSSVLLRYLENGHITQPDVPPNKPTSGQVSVYATTQARDDDKFTAIHGQWTADKTGGDQRGLLLTSTPFDDGRCFQFDPTGHSEIATTRSNTFGPGPSITEAPNRWCGTTIELNDESGIPFANGTLLTLYWVWDWPSIVPGNPGTPPAILNETYTSCMEVEII
ncbi:hypothetical protein PV08_12073 [Exophiala spinifera]|uniref:DUF7492 domain-containing protein n=1 Tax=Exophiala spinifera TaxID=91928 RepID=A0A0D1Y407_9EURO|nr:uncharacterized protein PV08_12073 [Exophiala spinifera]KIW09686.1 hypothetical protein PV08_12073 [Exophiala spinifera]